MPKNFSKTKRQAGFSLIEMIVSLGVFSVVITMSVGALLSLLSNNLKLQGEQNIMTNLTFAIDSMTREIRTGTAYYCAQQPNYRAGGREAIFNDSVSDEHEELGNKVKDCSNGRNQELQGISFIEGGSSITGSDRRILYFYDAGAKTIKRKVANNSPLTMVSSAIAINDMKFWVTGSEPMSDGDEEQPTVTIYLEAEEVANPGKVYYIHTTVTQRVLDL